jgi:hypothetical protein
MSFIWTEFQHPMDIGRVTLLSLIYQIGSLYLLVDWNWVSEIFIRS